MLLAYNLQLLKMTFNRGNKDNCKYFWLLFFLFNICWKKQQDHNWNLDLVV